MAGLHIEYGITWKAHTHMHIIIIVGVMIIIIVVSIIIIIIIIIIGGVVFNVAIITFSGLE